MRTSITVFLLVVSVLIVFCQGCGSPNWKITGQVEMVPADRNGDITAGSGDEGQIFITKGDTLSIRLDSVFVRQIRETNGAELLVYAEVYDIQPDDRQRLVRVLFKESNQAAGYIINQKDRLLFGPAKYNGRPLRIRLFVVELDKDENAVTSNMLKTAVQVAAAFYPAFTPLSGTATSIGDLFLTLNEDDRELSYDFTLYPKESSCGPYVRTGHYVIFKTEHMRRLKPKLFVGAEYQNDPKNYFNPDAGDVCDEYGLPISKTIEDYAAIFSYEQEGIHPLRPRVINEASIIPHNVLRVMNGQLWLQTVALEYKDKIIMADKRFGEPEVDWFDENDTHEEGNVVFSKRSYTLGDEDQSELVVSSKETGEESISMRLAQRFQYREKTHAIITVTRGGDPVDRSVFEEMSEEDQRVLDDALQPTLTVTSISNRMDELKNSLLKIAASRSVVKQVTAAMGKGDELRLSGKFPLAYLALLREDVDPTDPKDERVVAIAHNKAIIEIVRSMVGGFPFSDRDAEDAGKITEMKALEESNFKPGNDGTFTYVENQDPA